MKQASRRVYNLDRPHYLPNNYESHRDILIIVFANDLTPAANKYLYLI